MTLSAGTRLGRYEVISLLGAGGIGRGLPRQGLCIEPDRRNQSARVRRCLHTATHARVSDGKRWRSPAFSIRISACFTMSSRMATSISWSWSTSRDETLAMRLAQGPLPLQEALRLARGIGSGLAAAHRQGVVHRNLKPANVMLAVEKLRPSRDGQAPRLRPRQDAGGTRFGSHADRHHCAGYVVGTVAYMSPEQMEGREADARSDIFALGAILVQDDDDREGGPGASDPTATALDRGSAPPLFTRIVRKCLEREPDNRWQSAADLVDALQWVPDGQPSDGPAPRAGSRRVLVWIGAGLLTAAAAFALGAMLSAVRPAGPDVRSGLPWRLQPARRSRLAIGRGIRSLRCRTTAVSSRSSPPSLASLRGSGCAPSRPVRRSRCRAPRRDSTFLEPRRKGSRVFRRWAIEEGRAGAARLHRISASCRELMSSAGHGARRVKSSSAAQWATGCSPSEPTAVRSDR